MAKIQLEWPKRPTRPVGVMGKYKCWQTVDMKYRVTKHPGQPFVAWERYNIYDAIDDRHICGYQPIGENRTKPAAMRRCDDRRKEVRDG